MSGDTKHALVEEWRQIPFAPDYEASNLGRVRSNKTVHPRVLTRRRDSNGYVEYHFRTGGRSLYRRGAQAVLAAFRGPQPPNHDCCHINGDRTDDRLSNLRYGTRSQNIEDNRRNGTLARGEVMSHAALKPEDVRRIRASSDSIGTIARRLGVAESTVRFARAGTRWGHIK